MEVGEQWLAGFQCYGVAIGYVEYVLGEKVEELRSDMDKVIDLLEEHHHAACVLLSTSFSQQLDYLLTLQYPTDMEGPVRSMEAKLWEVLEYLAGQPQIRQEEEGLGVKCVLDLLGVESLQGRSYHRLIAAQPVKLGGLRKRDLQETIAAAFVGGVEQVVLFMVGWDGQPSLCRSLINLVGHMDGQQRWRQFLDARSRTSDEFANSWQTLSVETLQICEFLGKEFTGPLAETLEGAGEESTRLDLKKC